MQHFADKDGFNVFRLPVAWQSLVNNDLVTNELDATFWAEYDGIVQACLDTGAHCMYVTMLPASLHDTNLVSIV